MTQLLAQVIQPICFGNSVSQSIPFQPMSHVPSRFPFASSSLVLQPQCAAVRSQCAKGGSLTPSESPSLFHIRSLPLKYRSLYYISRLSRYQDSTQLNSSSSSAISIHPSTYRKVTTTRLSPTPHKPGLPSPANSTRTTIHNRRLKPILTRGHTRHLKAEETEGQT